MRHKQKSFNIDGMKRLLVFSALLGIVGVPLSLLLSIFNNLTAEDDRKKSIIQDFQNAVEVNDGGVIYKLNRGHSVKVEKGQVDFFYDFEANLVTIDGPGNTDFVEHFKRFESQENIEKALQYGCQIADQTHDALRAFQEGNDEPHPYKKEYEVQATFFKLNYCLGK